MLSDRFGRVVSNIRISLNEDCNLDCLFCHREGHVSDQGFRMNPHEIQRITRVAASMGVRRVKLTGGEPTLRKDLLEIVSGLSSIRSIEEISMTTNGTLLSGLAHQLRNAGLSRVNITLDSLKPEVYTRITGHDSLHLVLKGIEDAISSGLIPVKLNFVVLRSVNDSEIGDLINFSSGRSLILQLIELVSKDDNSGFYHEYHCDLGPIEKWLGSKSVRIINRSMNKRRKYILPNGSEVEIVRPMHNTEFCANCQRLRLTSDGKLKPCLMREDNLIDVLTPMRRGATDSDLAGLILEAVRLREPYYRELDSCPDVS